MDKVITISSHSKDVFERTTYKGVNKHTGQEMVLSSHTPIEVVHYPVKTFEKTKLNLRLKTDFNFLTVAQWGPRKNLQNTIKWFVEEFIDRDVGLVVKTFAAGNSLLDRREAEKRLTNMLNEYPQRECKVYLLHGDMSDEEMHSLYTHPKIKALVSLTHGEGFGLPLFEAAYSGLPVIAPNWSGHCDFLYMPSKNKKGQIKNRPFFAKVDYDLSPIQKEAHWEGVLQPDSMWCYAQQGSYKMRLREMVKDYSRFKSQAKKLQKYVVENFSAENQYKKFANCIVDENYSDMEGWLENLDAEVHD